jgi:hypothetical protein
MIACIKTTKNKLAYLILPFAAVLSAQAAEIDFEGIAPGTILEQVSNGAGATGLTGGHIGVRGFNPHLSLDDNAAVVFDSLNPPGIDYDLGSTNSDFGGPGIDRDGNSATGGNAGSPYQNDTELGNVLIVNEALELADRNSDGVISGADSPAIRTNDADLRGQFLEFDFSTLKGVKSVTVNSVSYMDAEIEQGESGARVELFGPGIAPEGASIALQPPGDNGVFSQTGIDVEGVDLMRIVLNGSGAVLGVVFEEEVNRPCWVTTGGFFNAGVTSGDKQCTFGGNVGPPPSGAFEVNFHDGPYDGLRFHTNDINVVRCEDRGSTGPQQPGGKKGLEVDTLLFECAGRLNNVDGFTCDGFLLDAGEPQGKKSNDHDQIQLTVYDSAGAVAAVCEGEMDGGNVQIHPPNGGTK